MLIYKNRRLKKGQRDENVLIQMRLFHEIENMVVSVCQGWRGGI